MSFSKETEVTLTMTAEEWSVVLYGLDEQPRKIAQPIWDKINRAIIAKAKEQQPENGEAELAETN